MCSIWVFEKIFRRHLSCYYPQAWKCWLLLLLHISSLNENLLSIHFRHYMVKYFVYYSILFIHFHTQLRSFGVRSLALRSVSQPWVGTNTLQGAHTLRHTLWVNIEHLEETNTGRAHKLPALNTAPPCANPSVVLFRSVSFLTKKIKARKSRS